jgi:transposase
MAYSEDFRKRAVEFFEAGNSKQKTMDTFAISYNSITKWVDMMRETGSLTDPAPSRPCRNYDPKDLIEFVAQNPSLFLKDYGEKFNLTIPGAKYALNALGITRKKKLNPIKNATNPNDNYIWKKLKKK